MKSQKVEFPNSEGATLSGQMELPLGEEPAHYAIFAHCFTCGKDLRAERKITRALTQKGFGVLRFDFTGLGQSGGNFADSNFTSNVEDIKAASDFLKKEFAEPKLLIGHSLGGTAVLMAGSQMENVKAIASINAPCSPSHVLHHLKNDIQKIKEEGKATVSLAGRDFKIKSQFVEDLENQGMQRILKEMRGRAILILHSPQDQTVGVENAREIYSAAHHPKSFVGLDGASHLLENQNDATYAGEMIACWVSRYLSEKETEKTPTDEQVLARIDEGPFLTEILAGPHRLLADEPESAGGENLGPTPYELVAAGLGACTAMTLKMYARRKEWPLDEVNVHLSYDGDYQKDCEDCEDNDDGKIGKFDRRLEIKGDLDEKQRERLLKIANKCPVHKTLEAGAKVETEWKD